MRIVRWFTTMIRRIRNALNETFNPKFDSSEEEARYTALLTEMMLRLPPFGPW